MHKEYTHCTTPAPHIHSGIALAHHNAVIVRACGSTSTILIWGDLNVGDVFTFVGQRPQLPDDFIDILEPQNSWEKACKKIAKKYLFSEVLHWFSSHGNEEVPCQGRHSTCRGRSPRFELSHNQSSSLCDGLQHCGTRLIQMASWRV